jgi:PqqD family protein of HPr-rel-A system
MVGHHPGHAPERTNELMVSEIDPAAACLAPRPVWRLMPGQLLRNKTWDGVEHLLYNDLSGDTHLLGADALDLLLLLQRADSDEATLAAQTAAGDDAVAPDEVAAILADLAKLSLVERRPC